MSWYEAEGGEIHMLNLIILNNNHECINIIMHFFVRKSLPFTTLKREKEYHTSSMPTQITFKKIQLTFPLYKLQNTIL